jgi:hypothetical protein
VISGIAILVVGVLAGIVIAVLLLPKVSSGRPRARRLTVSFGPERPIESRREGFQVAGIVHKGFERKVTIAVEPPGAVVENLGLTVQEFSGLTVNPVDGDPMSFWIGAPAETTEGVYMVDAHADAVIGEGEGVITTTFEVEVASAMAQNLAVNFGEERAL